MRNCFLLFVLALPGFAQVPPPYDSGLVNLQRVSRDPASVSQSVGVPCPDPNTMLYNYANGNLWGCQSNLAGNRVWQLLNAPFAPVMNAWGDSTTWCINGNTPNLRVPNCWVDAVAAKLHIFNYFNYGYPGVSTWGMAFPNSGNSGASSPGTYQHVVAPGELNLLTIGINDMRNIGADPNFLQNFQQTHLAQAAFLAVPDSAKLNPRSSSQITFTSGTWSNSPVYTLYGMRSQSNNAQATITGTGRTFILGLTPNKNSAVVWTVAIDGTTAATISGATPSAFGPISYEPAAYVFEGLSDSPHTITLTMTTSGGNFGYFDWCAFVGGSQQNTSYPPNQLYVGTVQRATSTSYAACTGGTSACNETNVQAMNQIIKSNVATLARAGLNVSVVDFSPIISTTTDLGSDGLHEIQGSSTAGAETGYYKVASAFVNATLQAKTARDDSSRAWMNWTSGQGWDLDRSAPLWDTGAVLASAATITPRYQVEHVSGTAAISTITVPAPCATVNASCALTLIPDGAWTMATGGNIAAAVTATAAVPVACRYVRNDALWYCH